MKHHQIESNYTLDQKTYKEFSLGYLCSKPSTVQLHTFIVIYVYIILLTKLYIPAIILDIIILSINQTIFSQYKINYKRSIEANGKKEQKQKLIINNEGIHCINEDTQNKTTYKFEQIISLAETKNQLILKLNYNLGLIINKNTLQNATREELIEYLFNHCNNLTKKKIYNTNNHHKIIITLIVLIFINLILSTIGILI